MTSALEAGVERVLVEDRGVAAGLDDHLAAWVEQAATVGTAEQSLWRHLPFDPGDALPGCTDQELPLQGAAAAAGAGELPVKSLVGCMSRRQLIGVSFDGNTRDVGMKFDDGTSRREKPLQRLFIARHERKVTR